MPGGAGRYSTQSHMRSIHHSRLVLGLFLLPALVRAEAPDLTNMGRLLVSNKSSIQFLDNAISNLGRPDDVAARTDFPKKMEDLYRKAIQHDFYAQLWYLQGNYSNTYRELKESQNQLQQACRQILVNYIDETWVLLEESAPLVVRTRDHGARHLLRLGYRDLESARLFFQRGNNIKPTLHQNQILEYEQGIKRIRRSRRYAVLSLIEAKLPNSEKPKYQVVTLDDVRRKKEDRLFSQSDYERVLNTLINLMGRRLLPRFVRKPLPRENSLAAESRVIQLELLEIHQDNYSRLLSDRRSSWREIVGRLDVREFNRDKVLPTRDGKNRYFVPRSESAPKTAEPVKEEKKEPGEKKEEPAVVPPPTKGTP